MDCDSIIGVRLTRHLGPSTPARIQMVPGGLVRTNCRRPAARLGSRLVSPATVHWEAFLTATRFSFRPMDGLGDRLLSGTTGAHAWVWRGRRMTRRLSREATAEATTPSPASSRIGKAF